MIEIIAQEGFSPASEGLVGTGFFICYGMAQTFSLGTGRAILSSSLLPVINLLGIYACQFLFRVIRDEAWVSGLLFCISALSALALKYFGAYHIAASLAAFALIAACMTGINLMLVSFVPAHFSRRGMVSFLSGLTNSMVYAGSSISAFSIALTVGRFGWDVLILVLAAMGFLSALFCLFAVPGWRAFLQREMLPP